MQCRAFVKHGIYALKAHELVTSYSAIAIDFKQFERQFLSPQQLLACKVRMDASHMGYCDSRKPDSVA